MDEIILASNEVLDLRSEAIDLLNRSMKQGKIELLDDWIRRLTTASKGDAIFPLAGQEFRNKIIEFIEGEKIKIREEKLKAKKNGRF